MDLKQEFAQKMLEGRLNYLPIEDAYELYKKGIIISSENKYVISVEDWKKFNYKGDETEHYIKEILSDYKDLDEALKHGAIAIGDDYNHFDEFTYGLFAAPTYMELID